MVESRAGMVDWSFAEHALTNSRHRAYGSGRGEEVQTVRQSDSIDEVQKKNVLC